MKNLEKNYHSIFNLFLYVLPVSFISMKLGNILVALFIVFNLYYFKKLVFNKNKIILISIIGLPLILDFLFFWNTSNFYLTLKATEKHALFLFFPVIIIGYNNRINFERLLKVYLLLALTVLTILFVRYIIIYPNYILKYLAGIHLWEMGYHFTGSFGVHAPSLNMHVAFVSVISFYFLINFRGFKLRLFLHFFIFLISAFFLFYINTRVAVVSGLIGYFFIAGFMFFKSQNKKQVLKKTIILFLVLCIGIVAFLKIFPYSITKFSEGSFSNMDMVGRLDEFENPEAQVFNALVTRVSIWKTALELSKKELLIGYGAADAKEELFKYYKKTDQKFLYKYKFPVHNQFIDFLLKYGILGLFSLFIFMFTIAYLGIVNRNGIMLFFFMLFFLSNLTDDFLILYSGISFSAFWFSIFGNILLNKE